MQSCFLAFWFAVSFFTSFLFLVQVYPVEGALYHAYPGDWQIWKAVDGESAYERIGTFPDKPSTSEITETFARDRVDRERKLFAEAAENGTGTVPLPILLSMGALGITGAALYLQNNGLIFHL